ncbi:MAG: CBS domain-containing protein [Bacteroidia bacterium]|nr:CBS domain-containing protein [Bacteroidia bacterium]
MLSRNYIAADLPTVRLSDPADRVLTWMEEYFMPHLPVVEDRELKGILSASAITALEDPQVRVGDLQLIRPDGHFVFDGQHVYDAVQLMTFTGHSVVPVLDAEAHYLGVIGREQALQAVSGFTGLHEPGGVLVLTLPAAGYHLREIASIVESADAQVLSLYMAPLATEGEQWLVLKLNVRELGAVEASFERYGYRVALAFYDQPQLSDTTERYNALMNYLSI